MMSYDYATQRPRIFTEDGVALLLTIRDHARVLLDTAGAVQMNALIAHSSGDAWDMLACVDFMCERDELVELTKLQAGVAGQHRVFVRGHRWREA